MRPTRFLLFQILIIYALGTLAGSEYISPVTFSDQHTPADSSTSFPSVLPLASSFPLRYALSSITFDLPIQLYTTIPKIKSRNSIIKQICCRLNSDENFQTLLIRKQRVQLIVKILLLATDLKYILIHLTVFDFDCLKYNERWMF